MKKNAFTLLELLVVVAIIGTLSAIMLPNFTSLRQKARDATRKSDLRTIQKGLELYRQSVVPAAYPAAAASRFPSPNQCWTSTGFSAACPGAGATIYLRTVPADPIRNPVAPYYYAVAATAYTLAACLENGADPDGVACPGGFACTSGRCYSVSEQ